METCFKCGETKPVGEFYAHAAMADGYLNKCKSCSKSDVQANYRRNKPRYQAYEQSRKDTPVRKEHRYNDVRKRRLRKPDQHAAHQAVANAVKTGRLKRLPCEVCGDSKVQGHHDDYSKPLTVRWVCFKHHQEIHGKQVSVEASI